MSTIAHIIPILLVVGFFGFVLSDNVYAIPPDNPNTIRSSPDTINGYFNIFEKLYTNGSTSFEYHLFVKENNSNPESIPYILEFDSPPHHLFDLSGSDVDVVLKTNFDNSSRVLSAKSMSSAPRSSQTSAITVEGSRLTTTQLDHVTLLAKFANTTTPSNGVSWYESLLYTQPSSLYNYFAHHSYNKILLKNNGIIDWFNTTLPNTNSYDTLTKDILLYTTIIDEYFSRNLTLNGADHITYNNRAEKLYYDNTHDDIDVISIIINDNPEPGVAGFAYMSPRQVCDNVGKCSYVFINVNVHSSLQRGAMGQFGVIAHELGHNLNWQHTPPPLPFEIYDDPWSLMSNSYTTSNTVSMVGFNKYQSNWIEHSDIRTVLNNHLDTFKLTYLGESTIVNDAYKLAIIPFGTNGEYYTLEARKPSVFDKTPSDNTGLVLYHYNPSGHSNTDEYESPLSIVNVTPSPFVSSWYLAQSKSYTDVRNITITNVNIATDYIEVTISNSELYPLLTTVNTVRKITSFDIPLTNFDRFGSSVTYGYVNNDTDLDLIVGSPHSNAGGRHSGSIHVIFAQPQQDTFIIDSTVTIDSNTVNSPISRASLFGQSLANLGDLDGNGIDEFIVGAPEDGGTGAAHILFFNHDASINRTLTINSNTINGPNLSFDDYFGGAVANIGDLNGDGFSDIAISADETSGLGAVYIFFMNGTSILSHYRIDNDTVNTLNLNSDDYFGVSIANIGDLNQDGIQDLAVGSVYDGTFSTNASNTTLVSADSVYILFMNRNGSVQTTAEISSSTPNGPRLVYKDWFGSSITGVGDLNGDDIHDIAVGAIYSGIIDTSYAYAGIAYILFLDTDGSVKFSTIFAPYPAHQEDDFFGASMATLPTNDTLRIIIGAIGDDTGGNERGAVYILDVDTIPFLKPIITLSQNVTSSSLAHLIITFNREAVGFNQSDILITNGIIKSFNQLNDTVYAISVLPTFINDVLSLSVIANSSTDSDGYGNVESNNFTITYDTTPPLTTLTLNSSNITNKLYVNLTVDFSKPVFNFINSSISINNANITNIAIINSQQFILTISPSNMGDVSVSILADSTISNFGATNNASNVVTFLYDSESPTLDNATINEGTGVLNITFSETLDPSVNLSRLLISEFNSSNQILLSNTYPSIINSTLTFNLNETQRQSVIAFNTLQLNLLNATIQDLAGNYVNTTLNYNFTLIIPDTIPPVIIINTTSTNFTSNYPIILDISFNESLSNSTFTPTVLNATFELTSNFTLSLLPTIRNGTITIIIPADMIQDTSNNSNLEYTSTIIYTANAIPSMTSPSNFSSNSTTWFVSSSDNTDNSTWQWFPTHTSNNCATTVSNNINPYVEDSALIFTSNAFNTQKVCFSFTDSDNVTTFHESDPIIPTSNITVNINNSVILSETDSFLAIQTTPNTTNHMIQYNTSASNTTLAGFNFISNASETVNTLVNLNLFPSTSVTSNTAWNGSFILPRSVNVVIPPNITRVTMGNVINTTTQTFTNPFTINIGTDSSTLNFSQPVKLVFNTTAQNLRAFYQNSNNDLQLINEICPSDNITLVHSFLNNNMIQECYALSNTGITIWTLHATHFGYYTLVSNTVITTTPSSSIPISVFSGGGGGGSSGSSGGSSSSAFDSSIAEDFSIYKVTWETINDSKTLQIFTKQNSNTLPSVTVRSSSLGIQSATLVSGKLGNSDLIFGISLDPKDTFIHITAIIVSGRQVLDVRETVTLTDNSGEITFDDSSTTSLPSINPTPSLAATTPLPKPIVTANFQSALIKNFVDALVIKHDNTTLSDITPRESLYDNFALVNHDISDQYVTTLLVKSDTRIIALLQISHTDMRINSARAVSLDDITIRLPNQALKSIDGSINIDVPSSLNPDVLKIRHQDDSSEFVLSDTISEFLDSISIHNLNTMQKPMEYFILQNDIIADNTFTLIGFSDRTDTDDSNNDVNVIIEIVSNNDSINRIRAVQLGGDKIMINDISLGLTPELNITYP